MDSQTHSDGLEEVQVGQEVALGLVEPVGGRAADDLLRQEGHVAVGDVDELVQRRGVAQVPQVEAEAFGQHLEEEEREQKWGNEQERNMGGTCV